MRVQALLAFICALLAADAWSTTHAQPFPTVGPPFGEVEATWNGFWTAAILGDLAGTRKYVHSSRQALFPGKHTVEELQEVARQMAFCRLDPVPFPLGPDELIYWVRCEHGSETAESLVGLRRDMDGVWRFSTL